MIGAEETAEQAAENEALPPVRRLEQQEILEWLKRVGVRGYRYRTNVGGSWFLLILGAISLGVAAVLAAHSGLSLPIHKLAFALLSLFTLWAFWIVAHWALFAARNYVGVSDDELLIGRGARADVIPRARLNAETIRMEKMRRGDYTSVLPIEVDGFRRSIHLIGPFANLHNVQQFIADVLAMLLEEDEAIGQPPGGAQDVEVE